MGVWVCGDVREMFSNFPGIISLVVLFKTRNFPSILTAVLSNLRLFASEDQEKLLDGKGRGLKV